MHVNNLRPNILHDMLAAARSGRDLRNGPLVMGIGGKLVKNLTAKRYQPKPEWRKAYPYASERQVKRQQRKAKGA